MARRLHILYIFVFIIVILGLAGEWVNAHLSYDRAALEQWQFWRLITGHLVHTNNYHTLMNLSILLVSAYLFGRSMSVCRWLGVFLLLCLLDSLGLYVFSANVINYVGLSGVLYGILAVGLLTDIRQNKWAYGIALLLIFAKIVWEQMPGYDVNFLRDKIDAVVIVDAHLYGFVGGILLFAIFFILDKKKRASRPSSA